MSCGTYGNGGLHCVRLCEPLSLHSIHSFNHCSRTIFPTEPRRGDIPTALHSTPSREENASGVLSCLVEKECEEC